MQLVPKFTPDNTDIDNFIESIVILAGKRHDVELEHVPDYFWPTTGKYQMRDVHKIFIDDESYHAGHGHAYETYGIDVGRGAIVIVRPDQYVSKICSLDDFTAVGDFFTGCALPRR